LLISSEFVFSLLGALAHSSGLKHGRLISKSFGVIARSAKKRTNVVIESFA